MQNICGVDLPMIEDHRSEDSFHEFQMIRQLVHAKCFLTLVYRRSFHVVVDSADGGKVVNSAIDTEVDLKSLTRENADARAHGMQKIR